MSDMGFEGAGYDNGLYMTEKQIKKEGWKQAKIFICLAAFMMLCLIITASLHFKELKLIFTGNLISVDYEAGATSVTVYDDAGQKHYIQLSNVTFDRNKTSVKLYYYGNDIANAKPVNTVWFWVVMYCMWVPLIIIFGRCAYRNIHPKSKHVVTKE